MQKELNESHPELLPMTGDLVTEPEGLGVPSCGMGEVVPKIPEILNEAPLGGLNMKCPRSSWDTPSTVAAL